MTGERLTLKAPRRVVNCRQPLQRALAKPRHPIIPPGVQKGASAPRRYPISQVTAQRQKNRIVIEGGRGFDPKGLLQDLWRGLKMHQTWRAFAMDEVRNRYRRSILGLAWLGISYLLYVFAIALFFNGFSELGDSAFVSYVAFGFAIFTFLISNVVDGCSVFTLAGGWIKSAPLPYSIYVFKAICRATLPTLIHLCLAFIIALFTGWRPGPLSLLAVPAFALMVITAVPVQYALGLVCARARDIGHFVQAISRLLFFTTPILWVYGESEGLRRVVANLNPLTSFVEIFRGPIIGEPTDPTMWMIACGWSIAAWLGLAFLGSAMRSKLPFWV